MKLFTRTDSSIAKKTVRIYLDQMRRERRSVVITVIGIPLSDAGFSVVLPLLISYITQALVTHPSDLSIAVPIIVAMIAVVVVSIFANYWGFDHLFRHEERATTRLTKVAMDGLLRHSQTFFTNQKVGSLAGDINTFSRSYMAVMDTIFLHASSMIVNVVVSLLVIAWIAPILLIPLLCFTAIAVYQAIKGLEARAPIRNERKTLQSKLYGSIADVLGNQTLVRIFGRGRYEVTQIVQERRAIEKIANRDIDILQRYAMYRIVTLYCFQIMIVALCVWLFSQHMLALGAFIFTITYLARFSSSIFGMNAVIRSIEQAFLDAAKVTEILALPVEVTDVPHAASLRVDGGEIVFSDVTFAYPDNSTHAVFERLDVTIPSGQRVGLVGRSGGGKTTLTSLLLRYMDTTGGTITIDGQDIAEVAQESLREHIGYVPQDPFLFHRSLRDNIAYGRPDASDADIRVAAEKAQALGFIEAMPAGLDTVVGERGVKLSGGQRQRIAVARAILKDAPILVLDEATSALDSESEVAIQRAFDELMQGRTSIVIAHRLSTIAKLDRIIVLDDGKIVEDGTHQELIERQGAYARLWAHQSGGFIRESS